MSTIAGWAHYNLLREPGQGFSLRKARCCLKYFGVFFAGKNRIICVIVPRICPRKGNFVTSTDVTIRSAARMKSFVWVLFGRSSAEFQRFFYSTSAALTAAVPQKMLCSLLRKVLCAGRHHCPANPTENLIFSTPPLNSVSQGGIKTSRL